jgi:release factor glutamine methyltransferase
MPVLEINAETTAERADALMQRATRALAEAGVKSPGRDARLLVAAATGLSAAELLSAPETPIDPEAGRKLAEMVKRRCAREPVSRILGAREFYGRTFAVTPATLDPRPDSETLIELALELADANGWRARPIRILDIGTGSGCLLVTLLAELPQATGVGGDINKDALAVAADNARRHGVLSRMHVALHDGLSGVAGSYDLLICNPPYVASGEISQLSPEVRNFDPLAALDGGPDGMALYRAVLAELPRVLAHGWALFEVGAGQADAVAQLLRNFIPGPRQGPLLCRQDLGGHTRCVAMEIQL